MKISLPKVIREGDYCQSCMNSKEVKLVKPTIITEGKYLCSKCAVKTIKIKMENL